MSPSSLPEGLPLLTEEELLQLDSIGHVIHRPAGHIYISEGEESTFALLIRKGHVKVVVGKSRVIAIRGVGEMVGEMAAIRQKPRSATVVALDDVEMLYLPARDWLDFLYAHPRAMHALLYATDERLDQASRKIPESDLAVEQRLAKAFVELIDEGIGQQDEKGVLLNFSQQSLAEMTGAKIDSVKKIIRTFKDAELVETGRRQALVVVNTATLREIADGHRTAMR